MVIDPSLVIVSPVTVRPATQNASNGVPAIANGSPLITETKAGSVIVDNRVSIRSIAPDLLMI